jgi:hypothetical protein
LYGLVGFAYRSVSSESDKTEWHNAARVSIVPLGLVTDKGATICHIDIL